MKFTTAIALSGAALVSAAAIDTRGGAPDNYCPAVKKTVRITHVETKVFQKIHTITKEEAKKCGNSPYDPKQVYSYLKDHKYPTYKPTSTKGVYPTGTWYGNGTNTHTPGPTGGAGPSGTSTSKGSEPSSTPPPADEGCSNPRVRVEWRNLGDSQRDAYISAVRCMIRTPSSNPSRFPGSRSLHEDMASLHQQLANDVHSTGTFLTWHRYMVHVYEELLRSECGYTGPMPWWDETRDVGDFGNSPLFNSRWFGTLRSTDENGLCVDDAGWGDYTANVGPGWTYDYEHCVARNLDNGWAGNNDQASVDTCRGAGNYDQFRQCNEGTYHASGHYAVGSSMRDAVASPVDPVFYLHHGFVDRNYAQWQGDQDHRIYEVGGWKNGGGDTVPEDRVSSYGLRPDVTIADVLDTKGGYLCYRYDY